MSRSRNRRRISRRVGSASARIVSSSPMPALHLDIRLNIKAAVSPGQETSGAYKEGGAATGVAARQMLIGRIRVDGAGAGAGSAESAGLTSLRWSPLTHGDAESRGVAAADCRSSGVAWFRPRRSLPVAPKPKPANEPASRMTAATSRAALILSVDRAISRLLGKGPAPLRRLSLSHWNVERPLRVARLFRHTA